MLDTFAILGLKPKAALTSEELKSAYFSRCKSAAPAELEPLHAALAALEPTDKRLRQLLDLRGPAAARQWRAVTMPEDMMSIFLKFGELKARADALLAKRTAAQSALAKALPQPKILAARDSVEELAAAIQDKLQTMENQLPALDEALLSHTETAWRQAAELQAHFAYLLKWQAQVRELLLRLE